MSLGFTHKAANIILSNKDESQIMQAIKANYVSLATTEQNASKTKSTAQVESEIEPKLLLEEVEEPVPLVLNDTSNVTKAIADSAGKTKAKGKSKT